jgi:hypothetical protein
MEFFIKKGATLPLLKMQVVKDGRVGFQQFMDMLETSSIYFTMVNTETGIAKIISKKADIVEKDFIDPNTPKEYYIYYKFSKADTLKVGRYEGQFLFKNHQGNLILPLREKLYINVQESLIDEDQCCEEGYSPPNPMPTPTPTPDCCDGFILLENAPDP